MEFFSDKEKKQLEQIEKKDVMQWSKKDWEIRRVTYDLDTLKDLSKLENKTIYTILRRVSSDGMNRIIDMFHIENSKPIHIHFNTSRIFQKRIQSSNGYGYKVGGCGMDMGFHLVNSLSYTVSRYLDHELDGYRFKQEWF